MSGPIPAMLMSEVQCLTGQCIEAAKHGTQPEVLHYALSVAEYLKDARRWHWIVNHKGIERLFEMSPAELKTYVDSQLEKSNG